MAARPIRRRLPPRPVFFRHLLRNLGVAALMIAASLALGAFGYHASEGLPWLDATLNAAMILTGMGQVDPLHTTAGKLFATCYALFSGVAFLTTVAVALAPAVHRLLHRFHLELAEEEAAATRSGR
jgi:hypothetical protein